MFRRKWVKTTGVVLDSRIRKIWHDRTGTLGDDTMTLHNYVVEFLAPTGKTNRLEVEQHIETVDVQIGDEVPLLVSPDGTKAVFDRKDPRLNPVEVMKARKAADEERFRQRLEGN